MPGDKQSNEQGIFNNQEKPPMTFSQLLEELKGGYILEQVKDLPVLINGKLIDHISFRADGVDFVSKQ